MVPTVISADPDGPKRASLPSMLPPILVPLATWETDEGSRWLPCSSACMETIVWARKITAITARRASACLRRPIMRPNMTMIANGKTMTSSSSKMFVKPVGFSNGCAPPTPYMLPPLVPSSLMTSMEATGPPGMSCVPPNTGSAVRKPLKFCTTPWLTSTSAPMTDSGTNTRTRDLVRSAQKLPIRADFPGDAVPAMPRTTASATASPTAAAVNCATTSPAMSAK
jgi:hypothetical protein